MKQRRNFTSVNICRGLRDRYRRIYKSRKWHLLVEAPPLSRGGSEEGGKIMGLKCPSMSEIRWFSHDFRNLDIEINKDRKED